MRPIMIKDELDWPSKNNRSPYEIAVDVAAKDWARNRSHKLKNS